MQKVGGSIGHYGLDDWWLTQLTEEERTLIEQKFNPMGGGNLTTGSTDYKTSASAVKFLTGLATWFESHANLPICLKILAKAEALITPDTRVLDVHFLYGMMAKNYWKARKLVGDEQAILACQKQIRIAPKALEAFRENGDSRAPGGHAGFETLIKTHMDRGDFDKARAVCRVAVLSEWWTQDIANHFLQKIDKKNAAANKKRKRALS